MTTYVKIYAFKPRESELLTAEIPKGQKFVRCIVCGRGVPVERRCHGYHYTKSQPAARRVRWIEAILKNETSVNQAVVLVNIQRKLHVARRLKPLRLGSQSADQA